MAGRNTKSTGNICIAGPSWGEDMNVGRVFPPVRLKIKIGVLLTLAVASLVLFVLWLTDVIGLGSAVVLIIVLTAASVGVRVWAENAGHKPE
ncbi:hypothetical protein MHK14_09925 [Corynebacterium minutissimum]|nr:hypothetical protein [Corynebacterium minutissimum]